MIQSIITLTTLHISRLDSWGKTENEITPKNFVLATIICNSYAERAVLTVVDLYKIKTNF